MNAFLAGGGEGEEEGERAWDGGVSRFEGMGGGGEGGGLHAFAGWRALSLPWWVTGLVYDVGEEVRGEVSRLKS